MRGDQLEQIAESNHITREESRAIAKRRAPADFPVLRENRSGNYQREVAGIPSFQDPPGNAAKIDSRHHDVRVEDDFHFFARTRFIALDNAGRVRRVAFAAFRALVTISAN